MHHLDLRSSRQGVCREQQGHKEVKTNPGRVKEESTSMEGSEEKAWGEGAASPGNPRTRSQDLQLRELSPRALLNRLEKKLPKLSHQKDFLLVGLFRVDWD